MILVSFSSAEDALSNDINKYNNFSSQGTENPPFRFFGTPDIRIVMQMDANYVRMCGVRVCTCTF